MHKSRGRTYKTHVNINMEEKKHTLTKLGILHVCLTAYSIFIMFITYTYLSYLVFTSVCKL